MTKKIVCLLLVCLIFTGCGKGSADLTGNTLSSTGETEIISTESLPESNTAATDATSGTEGEESAPDDPQLPTPVSYWNPICTEYITLFSSIGGDAVGKVPNGATIGLLGWDGNYAQVVYDGQIGYVYSNCLKPADPDYFSKHLSVVTLTTEYSYEQLQADMVKLQLLYPKQITLSTIGRTASDRDIPLMLVGDPNAKYQIMVQAAMHGREHFTSWLATAMVDSLLLHDALPADVCYHIVPMVNPDGVIISQTGQLTEEQMRVYNLDLKNGYVYYDLAEYARQWKANALGVDINRNFVVGWIPSDERPEPSSEKYRGSTPFSTPEALWLYEYTLAQDFDATLSLHAYGNVLYYQYGNKQPVNRLSYSLAKAVQGVTGYIPTAGDNTKGAGYKDWVMEDLGIPSLTVEIGSAAVPIVQKDTYNIFDRCREMLPAVYKWLTEN